MVLISFELSRKHDVTGISIGAEVKKVLRTGDAGAIAKVPTNYKRFGELCHTGILVIQQFIVL